MSQAKVDRYKKEKANRKKTMAREKAKALAAKACAAVVAAAIVVWAGTSFYTNYQDKQPAKTIQCDTSALDEYLNGISY